ncbi:type II toxin-antitoxin system RelE/ParE family toxin [Ancylobacter terrae]|uniref:type II toxin-antitoxin system RelE/ParE family toxin n=1 Tax=Ancylobacter sp. sgz301288 TaxID=3342077 RepID=UPI00385D5844
MAFRLLPSAESDLWETVRRIADDNPAAALRWYDSIVERCRLLGEMPRMGTEHPQVRPGLRTFPVGNYLILYREAEGGADIVRVVWGARKWQELLER